MISPVKAAVGPGYEALETRVARAVHLRFGLPADLPVPIKRAIKQADRVSAWLEAVQIAGFAETEADGVFGRPDPVLIRGMDLRLRPPAEARRDLVARHAALLRAMTDPGA